MRDDQPPYEFVTEAPDDSLYTKRTFCPFGCKDGQIVKRDTQTTLVGGGREANHEWHYCTCRTCGQEFTREDAHGATWYTAKGKVLAGFPNCYEGYTFTHVNCGGEVVRFYTELDGKMEAGFLRTTFAADGKHVKHYRTFFTCKKCAGSAEKT